jgi:hypothetical protein
MLYGVSRKNRQVVAVRLPPVGSPR